MVRVLASQLEKSLSYESMGSYCNTPGVRTPLIKYKKNFNRHLSLGIDSITSAAIYNSGERSRAIIPISFEIAVTSLYTKEATQKLYGCSKVFLCFDKDFFIKLHLYIAIGYSFQC